MAIAPIDLQTLFTQVDKVGRSVAAQKEGQVLQQSIQGVEIQRKTENHVNQVNEAQNMGDGIDKIKDKNPDQKQQRHGSKREENDSEDIDNNNEESRPSIPRHPSLGRRIDISL